MTKLTKLGVLGFAAVIASWSTGMQAAEAASANWQCSVGGFTGYSQADYFINGSGGKTVYRIWYRIDKGPNTGGNHANVHWNDAGTLPATQFDSGDAGIQDNIWRVLWYAGCNCGGYARGGGWVNMNFIFDKSNAPDPSCTATGFWS
jgi:hypothetical protein